MSARTHLVTADELFGMQDDGYCYELVEGRLIRMSPPGALHGVAGGRLGVALANYVEASGLGIVFTQDIGFKLASNPDTVRAPDVAFVRRDRIPASGIPHGYWLGPPDLAVEVRSWNDRWSILVEKAHQYLRLGTRLVWLLDPKKETLTVFRPDGKPTLLTIDDVIDGEDVVPGFRLPLAKLLAPV